MGLAFYHRDGAMGIIGHKPETGIRIDVERPQAGGPPWRYRGTATTAEAEFPVGATIEASGDVKVELAGAAAASGADLAEKIRLILRAVHKHAAQDGLPPARRIQRWRADDGTR
jgi:hypothetical protein